MSKFYCSPLNNKVIVIYNTHFFNSIFNIMKSSYSTSHIDRGGTIWYIADVVNILKQKDKTYVSKIKPS